MEFPVLFLVLLPIVAFLYAAVGHGGASGYLALMALFSFAPENMKSIALLLNLFVAGISFFHFARSRFFKPKLFLVFAVVSIPLSFLGGMLDVDAHIYKITLGMLLLFAIAKMLNLFGKENTELRKPNWFLGIGIGGLIGFFSGLIGIGGGIILSPVILLLRWGTVKEAAAVSALFIWVNSAAGIGGQFYSGATIPLATWVLVALALLGGFVGGLIGSKKWDNRTLRYALILVLILASIKLMLA
ncbi:sulfite exporter TauE/SafE family protein [Crocinitomicaceae bacterium]|nr:sulfite exporter TauE/SafE family protein [Crocinitomicaceae bacterium]